MFSRKEALLDFSRLYHTQSNSNNTINTTKQNKEIKIYHENVEEQYILSDEENNEKKEESCIRKCFKKCF